MRKLVERLSSLSGKRGNPAIKKPQCFLLELLGCLAELENDPGKKTMRNLGNGDTIVYKSDMGDFPEVFDSKKKHRVYDEQREFLCNCRTVLGKEEAF